MAGNAGTFAERSVRFPQSAGEAIYVQEGLGNAELLEFCMVEAALVRVADGKYGYCVDCGDKINEERLDVLPVAPKCRKCASKY